MIEMKRDAEFLRKVRKLAPENNMAATAKTLKIPVYTLKARLLSAAIKLGEIPPKFAKTRVAIKGSKLKKRKHQDFIRASGKGGSSRRVIIPQQIFQELNWNKGDKIVIRRLGKKKIVIEKSAAK